MKSPLLLAAAGVMLCAAAVRAGAPGAPVVETSETTDAKEPPPPDPAGGEAAPTWVAEWISKTGDAMQRVTLFADGVLVRKSVADGKIEMKKRKLAAAELDSYVAIFRAPEADIAAGTFDSGMSGERLAHSVISVMRADGRPWKIEFDSFSAVTPEAQRIRGAMEDLRDSFGKITASSGDFAPEKLAPGRILKRRDGVEFRIVRYDERARVVELKGLDEPYSQFYKLEDLAASFYPP